MLIGNNYMEIAVLVLLVKLFIIMLIFIPYIQ